MGIISTLICMTYARASLVSVMWMFLVLFSAHSNAQERVLPNCPLHVIIAVDFSASERAFLSDIQEALWALTERFELHPHNLKIGLISFNRGAEIIVPLTGERRELDSAIKQLKIPLRVYATDIHASFELAKEEFELRSTNGVPKILILISDGDPHAFSRGSGFTADLFLAERLKSGDLEGEANGVHIFSLYSGESRPFADDKSERVRKKAIQHMRELASDSESFYLFEEYPDLINVLEQISSCL